jgi:hypothetical protein
MIGQIFNAQAMFGPTDGLPQPLYFFSAAVTDSLSEFDGQPITGPLIARINKRVLSLQAIRSEIVPL